VRDLRESYPSTSKRLTAYSFLLRTGTVSCDATHLGFTELCLKYLSLPAFSHAGLDDQIRKHSRTGSFAFFEYALSSWTVHLEYTLDKHDASVSPPASLERVLQAFFQMHWMPAKRQTRSPQRIKDLADRINHFGESAKIKASLSSMHCLMSTNLPDMKAVYTLDLLSFLTRVRAIIEDLSTQPDIGFEMRQFYGQQLYKCPRIYCRFFHEGFANLAERNSHVERHDRSHLCKVTGCLYATLGYPKADDLTRHEKVAHPDITTDEDFSTLLDAGTQVDGDTQVDGSASENSLVGHAQDTQRSTEAPEYPDRFYCDLCPKQFTRAHNLRSHVGTHTDERPFVCTVCGKSFARQSDRKRHEALHGGEKPSPVKDP
jgi:hypothetical protein